MNQIDFTKALLHFSGLMPRYAPDFKNPSVVSAWFSVLSPYSAGQLNEAFMWAFTNSDKFPSVAEIKTYLGDGVIDEESQAKEIASRILAAISRFGSNRCQDAAAYIGDAGMEVVRLQGGWERVCETQEDQASIFQAQWRELAKVILKKSRNGTLDIPPALPGRPTGEQKVLGLVAKALEGVKRDV